VLLVPYVCCEEEVVADEMRLEEYDTTNKEFMPLLGLKVYISRLTMLRSSMNLCSMSSVDLGSLS